MTQKLPLHISNDTIIIFLKNYPQVRPTSTIFVEKSWDKQNKKMTAYYSGTRHIFVESRVIPPLPENITLDNMSCRLWH